MKVYVPMLLMGILVISCNETEDLSNKYQYVERTPLTDTVFAVMAEDETEPIRASSTQDAADDPAVWIHPTDPSKSIIYGSNKTGGIAAYDLSGVEVSYAEVGRINNIDVTYNIEIKSGIIDVCGGTNRTINAIDLYKIDGQTGDLEFILDSSVISMVDDVYGFCFYRSSESGINFAILCGKDGVVEHYEILEGDEKLRLKLVSSFDIGGQPEGMVADHKHGVLYIGEENNCIWRVNAEPGNPDPQKLDLSSQDDNPNIDYDIEGLTIYYTSSDHGYLIASSQGNDTYAIYDRYFTNDYIGSFMIIDGVVDGTTETDGIDVLNLNLGPAYPNGIFIAQDDRNINNGIKNPQNYKIVDWGQIALLFDPPLFVDTQFNVRSLFN